MNAMTALSLPSSDNVFSGALTLDAVRRQAPAVFAPCAHESLSAKYTFIPTERVLTGLMSAGFVPVEARQARTRRASPLHARHIVRLRRRFETVQLKDAVPEVVFLNSHDGTSCYQLRIGIFRVICTNGMIVSDCAFPSYCVSHRGNVVEEVIAAALDLAERFGSLMVVVERMAARILPKDEQLAFAHAALGLRFSDVTACGLTPVQLLTCRRIEDIGEDLWHTLNRVQENVLRGGLSRRSASGRLTRTRGITAIRKEVKINAALWELATQALAA